MVAVATLVVAGYGGEREEVVTRPASVTSPWLANVAETTTATDSPPPPEAQPEAQPDPGDDREPRRFTVAATGDLLVHLPVTRQAAEYGAESG